jgi:arabinose-5-phosphate isomerase
LKIRHFLAIAQSNRVEFSMKSLLSILPLDTGDYSQVLANGREVIEVEGRALLDLATGLGDSFVEAVDLLIGTKQRVIVSGMGKSGHVARKIAATLASTGTPALFVHPGEAAHGDLGMITHGDLLLILSNSGSTPELRSVVEHAKRVGSSIIAMGSQSSSQLMKAANVRLLLPPAREACPVNIAPTTSTTLMLAFGDALAVATMRVRGLTRERLQLLHPGGAIGGRLQPVEAIMHVGDKLPLVELHTPMLDVVLEMNQKSFGIAGVVSGGELIGVITDGDLRRHSEGLLSLKACDVLTPGPKVVPEGMMCETALSMLEEYRITALFVTAHDAPLRPVGLVHIHDLARSRNG